MRALVFLLPLVGIVVVMAYYAGAVSARRALAQREALLDSILGIAQEHTVIDPDNPLAVIVVDEITTHRNPQD